jgi:chromosome segregation ATPase
MYEDRSLRPRKRLTEAQRQAALVSQLKAENEELRTELGHQRSQHYDEVKSLEMQFDVKIYALNQQIHSLNSKLQRSKAGVHRLREELTRRVTGDELKLIESLSSIETQVSSWEERVLEFMKKTEGSMQTVNATISVKVNEIQTLRKEHEHLQDLLARTAQDLSYKEQELRMASDDHEIEVVMLKEELACANSKLLQQKDCMCGGAIKGNDHGTSLQSIRTKPSKVLSQDRRDTAVEELQRSLSAAEHMVEALQEDKHQLVAALQALQREHSQAKEKALRLKTQNAEIERSLQSKSDALELSLRKLRKDYSAVLKQSLQRPSQAASIELNQRSPLAEFTQSMSAEGSEQRGSAKANEAWLIQAQQSQRLKDKTSDLSRHVESYKESVAGQQHSDLQYHQDLTTLLSQEQKNVEGLQRQIITLEGKLKEALAKSGEASSHVARLEILLQDQRSMAMQYDQENLGLKSRVAELEQNVSEVHCNVRQLSAENKALQSSLTDISNEDTDLRGKLATSQEQASEFTRIQSELKRQLQAESLAKKALTEEKADLERLICYFRESIEEMRNLNAELKADREDALVELRHSEEVEVKLRQEVKALDEQVRSLTNSLELSRLSKDERADKLIGELTERAAVAQGAVEALKLQSEDLRKTVEGLRRDNVQLEKEVEGLKDELRGQAEASSSLKDLNVELSDEIERLKAESQQGERLKNEMEGEAKGLKTELDDKTQSLAWYVQQTAEFEQLVQELETKLNTADGKVLELREEVEDCRDQLETKLRTAEDQIQEYRDKAEECKEQLKECWEKAARDSTTIQSLVKKLEDQAELMNVLNSQLTELHTANQDLVQEMSLSMSHFEQLETKLRTAEDQVREFRAKAEEGKEQLKEGSEKAAMDGTAIETLVKKLEDQAEQMKVLSTQKTELITANQGVVQQLSLSKSHFEQLETKLRTAEDQVSEFRAKAEEGIEQLKECWEKAARDGSAIEGLVKKLEDQAEQMKVLSTQKTELHTANQSLVHELSLLKSHFERLEKANQELRDRVNIEAEINLEMNAAERANTANQSKEAEVSEEAFAQVIEGLSKDKADLQSQVDEYQRTLKAQHAALEDKTAEAKIASDRARGLKEKLRSAETQSKSLMAELEISGEPTSGQAPQSIVYNALKKAIELKGQENLVLRQQTDRATSDLQEAVQKSAHFKSLALSLQEELDTLKTKWEAAEGEVVKSASASGSLEQQLSDAEFKVLMHKNALRQKEAEIASLTLHCEGIETEVEKYQLMAKEASLYQAQVASAMLALGEYAARIEEEQQGVTQRTLVALDQLCGRVALVQSQGEAAFLQVKEYLGWLVEDLMKANIQSQANSELIASLRQTQKPHDALGARQLGAQIEGDELSSDRQSQRNLQADYRRDNGELKANLSRLEIELEELQTAYDALGKDSESKDKLVKEASERLEAKYRAHVKELEASSLEGQQNLTRQLEESYKKAQESELQRRLLEHQLTSALSAIAPGKRTDLTTLLSKNLELEKECRRLQHIQEHCDELELKIKAMSSKVKVLLVEREDLQRKCNSLSMDFKRTASDSAEMRSSAQLSSGNESLRRQRDDLQYLESSRRSDTSHRYLDSYRGNDSAKAVRTEPGPDHWAGATSNAAEGLHTEMSSEIVKDESRLSASSLQEQVADFEEQGGTLGQGRYRRHGWRVTVQASEIRFVIDSKVVYSSEDWRLNPSTILDCLDSLAQSFKESSQQAEAKLNEVIAELQSVRGQTDVKHNPGQVTGHDESDEDSLARRFETEWSEQVRTFLGDENSKSSDISLDLSDSDTKLQRLTAKAKRLSLENSDLRLKNQDLRSKSAKLHQRLTEDTEESRYKAMQSKQIFLTNLSKLSLKDSKTEELINLVCSLMEMPQSERVMVEKQRQSVKKGFFSKLL